MVAVVLVLVLAIGISVGVSNASQSATLYNSVRIENLVAHLQVLLVLCMCNKVMSIEMVVARICVRLHVHCLSGYTLESAGCLFARLNRNNNAIRYKYNAGKQRIYIVRARRLKKCF